MKRHKSGRVVKWVAFVMFIGVLFSSPVYASGTQLDGDWQNVRSAFCAME